MICNETASNTMMYIQAEKQLKFKLIIDTVNELGLDFYDIENTAIDSDKLSENIKIKHNIVHNLIKIINKSKNDDITYQDISTILYDTWGMKMDVARLNRGGCKFIKLVRSKYFNDDYPLKYNPDILRE